MKVKELKLCWRSVFSEVGPLRVVIYVSVRGCEARAAPHSYSSTRRQPLRSATLRPLSLFSLASLSLLHIASVVREGGWDRRWGLDHSLRGGGDRASKTAHAFEGCAAARDGASCRYTSSSRNPSVWLSLSVFGFAYGDLSVHHFSKRRRKKNRVFFFSQHTE